MGDKAVDAKYSTYLAQFRCPYDLSCQQIDGLKVSPEQPLKDPVVCRFKTCLYQLKITLVWLMIWFDDCAVDLLQL